VDILLGGKPDGLARDQLRRQGADLTQVDAQTWGEALARAREACAQDRQAVVGAGGLHVIGTERHEARRIDNQLRGRSGRQGDPGSSRFFASLEDDLMRRFGGSTVASIMDRLGVDEDIPIEHDLISRSIENAQVKVEGYNFDLRKHLLEYDDVVNQQRKLIYDQRKLILTSDRLKDTILDMVRDELGAMVMSHAAGDPIEWDLPGLLQAVRTILLLPENLRPAWKDLNAEQIQEQLLNLAEQMYEAKEQQLGNEMMRQLERLLMLQVVDGLWIRHLTALDELREGIGLRAFGQRDPLVEYKREAFDMFDELKSSIAHDTARRIYFANLVREPARREMRAHRPGAEPQRAAASHSASAASVGRNDPCPCGSGRKYKNCCMRKEQSAGSRQQAAEQASTGSSSAAHKHHAKKKRR
jgi:preprotein translocase subunit SecA